MKFEFIPTTEVVTLTNCDKEPIHIPGSIQPHGLLFVLEGDDFTIIHISENTETILGLSPQSLLGHSLNELISKENLSSLKSCLEENFNYLNPIKTVINLENEKKYFNGIIHESLDHKIILELEPFLEEEEPFLQFYHLSKETLRKLQKSKSLQDLAQVMVQEVRHLTEFDRVMVYRIDYDGSGVVIAEDKQYYLNPFLGLHFPASDIPQQARKLYELNILRSIPMIHYTPAKIIPSMNPITGEHIDLSLAVLRSVSPMHLEYLTHMGVGASMSISLIKDNKLWGLIACHHQTPKYIPYQLRTVCEFWGQIMSLEIASKENNEDLDYKIYLKSLQSKFIEKITHSHDFIDGLVSDRNLLLNLVDASGSAIFSKDRLILVGKTPPEKELLDLIEWIGKLTFTNDIFVTNCLPKLYTPAENFKEVASGLLVLSISKIQKNYVIWFRPEVIQTVNWGGDPNNVKTVAEDGSLRLSPRKSFAQWQEIVSSTSLPWKQCQIEGSIELRSGIIGLVLQKADELAEINTQLEQSNHELDAFTYIASHDLREPLRGIHNYSSFLLEDYRDKIDESGVHKLQTLMRLTERMEDLINALLHFSRLGRAALTCTTLDLNEIVCSVFEVIKISYHNQVIILDIPQHLPPLQGDRILVEEIFTNLMSNAVKYNTQIEKRIEIGCVTEKPNWSSIDHPEFHKKIPILYVKDNGIGIREKHLDTIFRIFKRLHTQHKYGGGTGAGLTIAKKIIERHGGQIWVESIYGQHTIFYFTLQKAYDS